MSHECGYTPSFVEPAVIVAIKAINRIAEAYTVKYESVCINQPLVSLSKEEIVFTDHACDLAVVGFLIYCMHLVS